MGKEIERKFLVKNTCYKQLAEGILYKQGYICSEPDRVVRVRVIGSKGFITIKGKASGFSRPEYEYEIPINDADEMIGSLCDKPIIEKYRYEIRYRGFTWEVDEFLGDNQGLVIAEIEIENEAVQFPIPEWIEAEVTGDPLYYNSNLIKKPYKTW